MEKVKFYLRASCNQVSTKAITEVFKKKRRQKIEEIGYADNTLQCILCIYCITDLI